MAQDDLRDRIELENGREVRGRVACRYPEPGVDDREILVLQGGKRRRIDFGDVASIRTVRDAVAEFFRLRDRGRKKPSTKRDWFLVEWAQREGLDKLARLLAIDIVLRDPEHEAAHEFLGNRLHSKKGWLWRDGSRWSTFEDLERRHADWKDALEFESEHFVYRTNAGHARAVPMLFDLERMLLWLYDSFGPQLRLHEVIAPIDIRAYADTNTFPDISSGVSLPYYLPNPHSDAAYTFYPPGQDIPESPFFCATQAILYRGLALDAGVSRNPLDRLCAWAEVGFGLWVDSCASGDAGYVQFGAPIFDTDHAQLALTSRRYYDFDSIPNRNLRDDYYNALNRGNALHWADAHMLAAYLLDERQGLRDGFLEYLHEALRKGRGASSSRLRRSPRRGRR